MKFHKFFNLKRFGRLMAADLQLNSKRYLYIFAGAAVALYLVFLFSMLTDSGNNYPIRGKFYANIFFISLIALGAYVGSAFPAFSEKPAMANFLLTPASCFEKLLSQFLIVIAGTVLFFFLFWLDANLVRLSLSNLESVRTGTWIIERFSYDIFIQHGDNFGAMHRNMFVVIGFFAIGCYLFTARLFFGKFALAKSVISGIAIVFLFFCLMVLCSHLIIPEKTQGFNLYIIPYNCFGDIWNTQLFIDSLCMIICLFFLPLAYFKLKEKQL